MLVKGAIDVMNNDSPKIGLDQCEDIQSEIKARKLIDILDDYGTVSFYVINFFLIRICLLSQKPFQVHTKNMVQEI